MFKNIKRGGNTVCTSHASCHSLLMFAPCPLEADYRVNNNALQQTSPLPLSDRKLTAKMLKFEPHKIFSIASFIASLFTNILL